YEHIKWIEDLVPNSMWSLTIVKYDKFALWGILHWGKKRRQFYAFATLRESARDDGSLLSQRLKLSNGMIISILTGLQYAGMMMFSTSLKKATSTD
ncbi:hypothetical protein Tco_0423858, partial [Tanacetum coccineum]